MCLLPFFPFSSPVLFFFSPFPLLLLLLLPLLLLLLLLLNKINTCMFLIRFMSLSFLFLISLGHTSGSGHVRFIVWINLDTGVSDKSDDNQGMTGRRASLSKGIQDKLGEGKELRESGEAAFSCVFPFCQQNSFVEQGQQVATVDQVWIGFGGGRGVSSVIVKKAGWEVVVGG